jgi:hypothetical protein
MKRLGEVISGLDPSKINEGLTKIAAKVPILGILVDGFNAMTPEEKATFTKNVMLAAAAMAAKNGGKVSF